MITQLPDFFEQGALARCPDKIALIDRDQRYTFADWDRMARSVAAALVARDVLCSQPVAVLLPKCAHEVMADLGILYAGCTFSNIDCSQPVQRLRNLMENLCPPVVLAGREQISLAHEVGIPSDRVLCVEDLFAQVSADAASLRLRRRDVIDTDPACIINTSGSTGLPKSCVLPHRGLIDFVLWFDETFRLGQEEIVGSLSPFHFDGWIPGLFMSLYRGATIDIIPTELAMFPVKLAQHLAKHRVTFIFWVPTVMVNMANVDALKDLALPDLRTVCFAGEVFPTKHCNYWRRHVPHATFINLYGPIEISVICTFHVLQRELADHEPIPIGQPCRNTGVLILDEQDRVCPDGETGELCIRGTSLAAGYWNDREKTDRVFRPNPQNTHYPETIYRTGDLVYRDTRGDLVFVGRRDFQVKHLGNRIDLGEIEHYAVQVPGIRNACVLYQKERKEIVLAYEADAEVPPSTIRTQLGLNLPKIMWPTVFHCFDELPRNANGKIDRQLLIAQVIS
jgi:D-alanine--poly(phosphoribitol) ligase subunit 1